MKTLLQAYEQMFLIRTVEEELVKLYLEKKIMSFVHFCIGQEAVAVGVCNALNPEDKVLGNHRSHGHCLAKGGDLKRLICELLGKEYGSSHGKGGSMHMIDKSVNFIGSTPILGSVVPLACGTAFAQKYNKTGGIAVAFIGDGAFEEGIVYETLNLAALFKLPLLLVVENNLFSANSPLSARRSEGHSSRSIVEGLGATYGRSNGKDYQMMFKNASQAVSIVKKKGKPVVLECDVYRHMAHSAPIFDEEYRQVDTLEVRLEEDPIKNLKEALLESRVSELKLDIIESNVRMHVTDCIASALAAPYPKKESLYTNVYA